MTADRRSGLDRDAGGDDLEESAVCYLQIVLADLLEGVGQQRLMRDMDTWGYSFRLGNTREWFERDAEDAAEFLKNHGLLTNKGLPTFNCGNNRAPVYSLACPGLRYLLYFIAIAFVTWALTQMELAAPGSLKLQVMLSDSDQFGTSEFSPVEIIQAIILGGLRRHHVLGCKILCITTTNSFAFWGMALIFFIRELDYYLDRYVADNFWQVLIVIAGSLVDCYTYRSRRRLQCAGKNLAVARSHFTVFRRSILFAFVRLVGHEPLWMSILGDDYRRIVKLAVEEFIELIGYFLWMIGTIEYAFQARAIAVAEPQPAARRRREKRRKDAKGRF